MKIFDNTVFDVKTYWRTVAVLLIMTLLQMASKGAAFAFLVPFALIAVLARRVEQIIFWLLASMILIVGNSYFLPKGLVFYVAQRILFAVTGFVMFVRVTSRPQSPVVSPLLGMFWYVVFMLFASFGGWNPTISLLKIFLFSVVYIAYYGVANMAGQSPRFDAHKVRGIVLAISSYLAFGSIALIPFPAISQLTGEEYLAVVQSGKETVSLFKGITMHSQTLGPVIATTFAFLFADLVVNVRKMNALYLALLPSCLYLVYLTSSRTGMAAALMGVVMSGFCVLRMKGIGLRWRGKVKGFFFLLVTLATLAVVVSPRVRNAIARYALKYTDSSTTAADFTVEGAMATRQGLIDSQLESFKRSPLTGNGFQVSVAHSMLRHPTWKDLLSAPIEKGVWVTAILEEGGLLGFLIFVSFIVVAGLKMLNRGAFTGLTVFCAMLVSNMAEFTIFSMSAMGGYTWALVFVGTAMDAARIRHDSRVLGVRSFFTPR
jgi:hypothetical protein